MYRITKYAREEAGKIFFISDLHYGQECRGWTIPLWELRGYKSKDEYSSGIIQKWNAVCDEQSIIYNLGDITFSDPEGVKFMSLMRQLRFKKHYLLIGNHTSGAKFIYQKALFHELGEKADQYEVYPLTVNVDGDENKQIIFLPGYAEVRIGSKLVSLGHYPIVSHNEQAKGSYSLSGHSHANCSLTNTSKGKGYRLDVGVESFGRPVNFLEIEKFFIDEGRDLDVVDHHNK